ncbi:hypothetical protein PybrP1_009042 [[Pythium] brassicae (nom. inval.)]|nr:hypothetical protein PybrP1_009042 [[Pythium] brassicae (nom. inval.)]
MEELKKRHASWCKNLQRAVETDGWGQVVEAVEAYERLAVQLTQETPKCHELSKDQARTLEKVAGALDLRAKCLSSVTDGERTSPTKEDMEEVLEVLCSALSAAPQVFPADLGNVGRPAKKVSTVQVVELEDADEDDNLAAAAAAARALAGDEGSKQRPLAGVLRGAGRRRPGETYFDAEICKIGLKDASTYTNPTIVVSVFDRDGRAMGEPVETLVGSFSAAEPQHISFSPSASVQLEPSLTDMEERGAAVFFEFYHYKPKKRKKSCRCWALLEMDEMGEVPLSGGGGAGSSTSSSALVLELYQKPMDPKRKRINLFTVKELYLHLRLSRRVHDEA